MKTEYEEYYEAFTQERFEINTLKNDITEKREIIQACLELTERQLQLKK